MITDNTFTEQELVAAVTANPALVAAIKTGLKGQNIDVFTAEEKTTFVEQERATIRNGITSEIYTKLDADILAATGIAKTNPEEKTYDYYKRTHEVVAGKVTAAEAKVADLQTKLTANSGDQALKDQLKAAQDELKQVRETTIPEYETKMFNKDVEAMANLALKEIKLKADLPEILLKPALDKAKADLIASAKKDADGNIYFTDKDGKTALNGANRATAGDLLAVTLKDVIDTGIQQPGGGTTPPGPGAAPTEVKNKDGQPITIPAEIKTKTALHDYLNEQGLAVDSDDFNKVYETHGAELPIQ